MTLRRILSAILALGLFGLFSVSAPASAQTSVCAPYAQVTKQLKQRYSEVPTAFGLIEDKSVMQLYASAESGTWTIVMTNRRGVSCIVAAGHSWEQIETGLTGPGA